MTDPSERTTVYSDRVPSATETLTSVDVAERLVPGTLVAGRYRVLSFRGLGGMGVVYKARDEELGVDVALKVLRSDLRCDPRWVQRFRRELVLARQVTHRNVVRIHDIGETSRLRFLTMDFVEGPSLGEVLDRDGPLTVQRAVAILRQLSEALQQAHAAGIVHRDLKPSNILLGPDDTAYITDFGVARSRDGEPLTRTGAIVGTPDYLSPEQLSGEPVDGRSDLYALGIVFYEVLTGKLPFRGKTQSETLAQRLTSDAPDVSSVGVRVPAGVQRVLRRCLTRAPARRYQQAREIVADLDRVERTASGWRFGSRLVIAACVALLVGVLVWWGARVLGGRVTSRPAANAVAIEHAVAVLPLADEARDPELAWVGLGGADLLARSLAASPDLRVVGPERLLPALSSLELTPGRYDRAALGDLGRLLDVDRIITGRVKRSGQGTRLDLQLASVAGTQDVTSVPLLSIQADNAARFFPLMNDLGGRLRQALDGDVPPDGEAPSISTRVPTAAAAYLEGQVRLHEGDASAAASLFQRAVRIDSHFAEALEGLSEAHQYLGHRDAAAEAASRAGALVGSGQGRLAERVRARLAMLRHEATDALTLYEGLAARYPNDTRTSIDLANAQATAGRRAQAIETLGRVTRIDPNNAQAWLLLGEHTLRSDNTHATIDRHFRRARTLYERLGDQHGMADVAEAMGRADYQAGDYEQALAHYADAMSRRERLGNQRALETTLRRRAETHLANGDRRLAAADIASARTIVQRLGERAMLADFLDETGAMYETHSGHGLALQAYQEALLMRRSLGGTERLAESYDRVGDAAFAQGDYADAPLYWNEALALRERVDDRRGVILSTQDLGLLAIVQGRWSEAIETFRATLERSDAISFQRGAVVSHKNLALLHHYRGRYGDALAALQEALAMARELDQPDLLTSCTLDEVALLVELGQWERARARLADADHWIKVAHDRDQRTRRSMLVGLLHERNDDAAAADLALEAAREEAEAGDNRAVSLRVRLAQARVRSERGDAQARGTLSKLAAEADSFGNVVLRLEAGAAIAGAELRAGRTVAAERRVRRTIDLADRVGWGAGRYRLHGLLGEVLKARGLVPAAEREQTIAQVALAEIRDGLAPELRDRFDALHQGRD